MKKVLNKKVSISYLFFILPILFFIAINCGNQVEDIWFLLAHGRYVLSHGIPHVEFLTMHSNLHFVMQQWAFSTILYLIYNYIGSIGVNIFTGIINLLILFFLYKLCMLLSNNKYCSCLIASIIDLLLELNFILPRPQIISLLLLIITLYLLEDYTKNKSNRIWFLLLVSILLINFHASIWPMMIIFCLPFIAEYIYLYFKNKDKRLFKLLVIIFLSILCAFINPYGIEALLYSFNSYGNPTINKMIVEMHPFTLNFKYYSVACFSVLILLIIVINLVVLKKNYKKYPIHYYFLLGGLSFMSILNIRNISFLLIGTLPYLVLAFKNKIKYKIQIKLYLVPIIIIVLLYSRNCITGYYTIRNTKANRIVDYLDKYASKDDKIFTCFNNGSYIEYRGYKVYMDSRAEIYLKKNNHSKDILDEYYNVYKGKANFDKFINDYDFDYLVVYDYIPIYDYLSNNSSYKKVSKQKDIYLFEKKDYSNSE